MTRLNTMKVIVLGLLCLLISANAAIKPGSKVFTRSHTLEVVKDKLLPLIPTILSNISMNATKFSIPLKDWMTIDVTLTPTIQTVEILPNLTNITFDKQSLSLISQGVGFNVTAKLYLNTTLFDSNGSIVINGTKNKITLAFDIKEGTQKVVVSTTSIDLSNVDLKITGDLIEDIIQAVWGSFKATIIEQLNTMISTTVKTTLQATIDATLAQLNGSFVVPGLPLGVYYNLTELPNIDKDHLDISVDNTFYNSAKPPVRPPIDGPVDLPSFDPTVKYDIWIYMTQYVLNSALYGLWDSGSLNGYLNSSTAPEYLKVSTFDALIPQLLQYYSPDNLVDLNVSVTTSAPAISMAKNTSSMSLKIAAVSIDIIVQTTDKGASKALTMEVAIDGTVTIFVTKNNSIQAKILDANVASVTIKESHIGPIDGKDLRAVMELAMKVILPYAQKLLEQYTLPIPVIYGIKLVNPTITFFEGYFGIFSAVEEDEEYWKNLLNRLVEELEGKPAGSNEIDEEKSITVKSFLRRI